MLPINPSTLKLQTSRYLAGNSCPSDHLYIGIARGAFLETQRMFGMLLWGLV